MNLQMKLSLGSHNWLIHRIYLSELQRTARKYAKGNMLDIGCATKPYESIFATYVKKYIGLDHQNSPHVLPKDVIIASAYDTKLSSSSIDTILCTEVLEHLERPSNAIREMHRLLKPGGYVILTVPMFWHLHEEPRDFYRYTKYGLKYLFEDAGFKIEEVKPLSGFIVTFCQELVYFLRGFRKGRFLRWIINILCFLIQEIAYILNRFDKSHNFTCGYLVVANKSKL
jgi:SAM-dependent methyltransferase